MGIENLVNYNAILEVMNKNMDLWGQNVSVAIPQNKVALGYENMTQQKADKSIKVDRVGNTYKVFETKCFINFQITKSTMYKFNYFPKEGQELVMAVFKSNSKIREGCYVVTATPQAVSIWGTLCYKVENIQDIGKYKTLKRVYFLSPTSNADLAACIMRS